MAHELPRLSQQKLKIVQGLVEDAIDEGWDDKRLQAELERFVGLTPRDQQAVRNKRKTLKAQGLPPGKVDRQVDAYTKTLKSRRAATIAATEMLTVEQGDLVSSAPPGSKKRWVTHRDERTCPVCAPLNGKVHDIDYEYVKGKKHPPLHPNCRCKLKIVG